MPRLFTEPRTWPVRWPGQARKKPFLNRRRWLQRTIALAFSAVIELAVQQGLNIAHVAPWLQNSSLPVDNATFPIFAGRQEQIQHALKTLSVRGMHELGAVYGSARDHTAYHAEVEKIAAGLKLKLQSFQVSGNLSALAQQLTPQTPAVLLFVGGTPELAAFT